MIFKDYYKILGLETNKVSLDTIKLAYRKQAKKYHPDVNIGNKKNEEIFKDINEAYKVLSTASSKRKYDRMWNHHVGRKNKKITYEESKRSKDSMFSDFFNMFFGTIEDVKTSKKQEMCRGENVQTEVNISIEDAFRGKEQKIAVRTVDGDLKTFKVQLPPGIQNNEKIRLVGQGKPGKNGGKNGDLFIKIKINNDSRFKLEGYNLRTNLYLTPWEAALSTKVTVNGINEDVSVYIPQGIQSGEVIKIEGRGYKNGKGGRGDLILETKIMVPKHLNDKEKELFDELNNISKFNPRAY
jgi:curved DNA-binding protein